MTEAGVTTAVLAMGLPSAQVLRGTALGALEHIAMIGALAGGFALLEGWLGERAGWGRIVAAVVAAGAAAWMLPGVGARLGDRPDGMWAARSNLVFCALTGFALTPASPRLRAWALALLSLPIVRHYAGTVPTLLTVGGVLCGFVAHAGMREASSRAIALVQSGILLATWWLCWQLRAASALAGLTAHGLLSWLLLRHVSFVISAPRDRPPTLGRYLCYLLFFPNCFGSSEVYSEFAARNFGPVPRDRWSGAARRLVMGELYVTLWSVLPEPVDPITGHAVGPALWAAMLLRFAKSAAFVMSLWATIEGAALLLGIVLRPNFQGLFTRRTPAGFWRAWRSTMTNWLIRHVYAPLGGNRRHQAWNVVAVFAVSTLWHWSGLPFERMPIDARLFLPVGLWGVLIALALILEARLRGSPAARLAARVPEAVRAPLAIVGTAAFGTLTTTLLGFGPSVIDRFPDFVRRFVGVAG